MVFIKKNLHPQRSQTPKLCGRAASLCLTASRRGLQTKSTTKRRTIFVLCLHNLEQLGCGGGGRTLSTKVRRSARRSRGRRGCRSPTAQRRSSGTLRSAARGGRSSLRAQRELLKMEFKASISAALLPPGCLASVLQHRRWLSQFVDPLCLRGFPAH